jgi:diguanylate cyclase (GGDEF)-like protein
MAHYDNLTDLPNRAAFNECLAATLDRAARGGEQFTILSVDLNRFKEANDWHGHAVGDALLREVARRLQAAAAVAFLARIGGDEFTLIVTDGEQPAAAATLAERLLATFVDDFEVEGYRLTLGATIGGAVYPTDGTDAKTLMINADIALYRAKAEARESVLFFEPQMSARLHERRTMEEDLRSALERDELLLHYQPQKKMSGETVGFEALVRWQCPKRGMVSPGVFIPIAEESDLIVRIGEWVLREACREAASWPQPLTIAVNISPIQFRQGDLPRLVLSVLLETGLAPARLELEITESVLIDDFSRAVSILTRLKSLGVRIALDDFGTGYSSLSYLHSFSFDKIKIDRIFIGDLEHSRQSMAIVRAVMGLGHSLGVPILAEGVETDAQYASLVQEGCDEVQGYLTGRPLPIADYAKLVGREAITQQNHAAAG